MMNNQPRRARLVGLKPILLKVLAFTISALTYQHAHALECSTTTFKIDEFVVCLSSESELRYDTDRGSPVVHINVESDFSSSLRLYEKTTTDIPPAFEEESDVSVPTEGLDNFRCVMRRHLGVVENGKDLIDGVFLTYSHKVSFILFGEQGLYDDIIQFCKAPQK